jgi:hypothetical protein
MGLGFEIRDPGKNLSWIPVPGVKKAPDPGSATKFILALNIFFYAEMFPI